ncbi:MAG: anti-sigma factor family protein [Blastocatellia bacterium]
MSCQDFETIIVEIARDRLMDAAARERGLAHVETCGQCAALLAEERTLSGKLRALSAAAEEEEIPARLETALLAAFRQCDAVPALKPARFVAPVNRRWVLAAAALMLLTFGLSLAGWVLSSSKRESAVANSTPEPVAPTPAGAPEKFSEAKPQMATVTPPSRRTPDAKRWKRQPRLPRAGDAEPREIVTQFFPVIQGSELIPLESGQIIRVRMPRSNLISLGIPYSQERADETIQADVLVSNDGLARAIRLVY